MISRIYGKLKEKKTNCIILDDGRGICYEILMPSIILEKIDKDKTTDSDLELVVYYYLQTDGNISKPVLIGFLNDIEKDFFEQFISVSGIGPRAAIKAINKPISLIARAIDQMDIAFLKNLPGIGQQRAKQIIAKLQGKIGKFGLMQDEKLKLSEAERDITNEAMKVLLQLQYKKSEAEEMIKKAFLKSEEINTTENLLNEIYKQKRI
ncbi:MAG: Holliday junction branch migration protein RuvA [Candidatus Gygaella obscura]|nr:Holliday junction branch migration protein RuvA [Candidatus Gygaella obscura]